MCSVFYFLLRKSESPTSFRTTLNHHTEVRNNTTRDQLIPRTKIITSEQIPCKTLKLWLQYNIYSSYCSQ